MWTGHAADAAEAMKLNLPVRLIQCDNLSRILRRQKPGPKRRPPT